MDSIKLDGSLKFITKGKVRELYQVSPEKLLFVATDRISAYDVILANGIPDKGRVLTELSRFWFEYLKDVLPNHLADNGDALSELPADAQTDNNKAQLEGRSLVVKKLQILPIEAIVRGYITGSAWSEYKKSGTVHGMSVPSGLQESQAFPEPIYTPSTKAEQGEHDENISKERAAQLVGADIAAKMEKAALALYKKAHDYAATKGIIIADTKFEFGIDENGELVLVDEVLTPDSSRFWPKSDYKVGQGQDSYDKQFVRNWLTENGFKGKEGVSVPQDIVEKTRQKYLQAYKMLTGKELS